MNEHYTEPAIRQWTGGTFLSQALVAFSFILLIGFQMMDQISLRSQMQAARDQQEPAFQQAVQIQSQIETLLFGFQRIAPEQAQEVFNQFNIQISPPLAQ